MNKKALNNFLTVFFSILSLAYIYPIVLVLLNSFKKKAYISKRPFRLPEGKTFVGMENYINGIRKTGLIEAAGVSLFVTVLSVLVIIVCTSMCAWYIMRVHNRTTQVIYYLCLFSMIVPFQMVMFPLSKIANMLKLSNPLGLVVIYLGFGAGLAVFMFTGFVKSIPLYADSDLLPCGDADHASDGDYGGDSPDDVDLE